MTFAGSCVIQASRVQAFGLQKAGVTCQLPLLCGSLIVRHGSAKLRARIIHGNEMCVKTKRGLPKGQPSFCSVIVFERGNDLHCLDLHCLLLFSLSSD
jgi:hypothetical protein